MAKGLPPLRVTKVVQNVQPIPVDRPNKNTRGANAILKLKTPKQPGALKVPKNTFS